MSQDLKILLGKNVKRYRKLRALSQKALADKIGKTNEYISGLEHGKHNPTASALKALADALDIDIALLFRENKESA